MPKNLHYEINIIHLVTKKEYTYKCNSITAVVLCINDHYGIDLCTSNSISRLLGKKHDTARYYKGITIRRKQNSTKKFPNGLGGSYPSVQKKK
jgi:hypothetical protein